MKNRFGSRAGFTILELAITSTLLAMILIGAMTLGTTAINAFGSTKLSSHAEGQLQRTLHKIVAELANTGGDVLIPSPEGNYGSHDFTFRHVAGETNGVVDWGPLMRIAWEPDPADPEDGMDNDQDGLVDEGQVAMFHQWGQSDEVKRVLCKGVPPLFPGETINTSDDNGNKVIDERGFNVQRVGNVLTIRLAIANADSEGRVVEITDQTAVRLRN